MRLPPLRAPAKSKAMSLAEIKEEVAKMNTDEVLYLAAYLHHIARRKSAAYLEGLDASMRAMDEGDRVPLATYREIATRLDNPAGT